MSSLLQRWITDAGLPFDRATDNVVQRRIERLEMFLGVVAGGKGIYEGTTIAADDAAALILWPKARALTLLRRFGLSEAHRHLFEDINVNMDWFYRPLDPA